MQTNLSADIAALLSARVFAVVGASRRPHKYGFLAYRSLKAAGKTVYPVNPNADTVDGDRCFASLTDLPNLPDVVVMVVPPAVTEAAVAECTRVGIKSVWMQPGAESPDAVEKCRAAGIAVVAGGPCIMVGLRTQGYVRP